MPSIPVDLPKKIAGETLEQACINAAKEIGYKAKSVDEYQTRYSLGSIQEHQDYRETYVRIGNLLPAFRVVGIKRGKEQDCFYILTELPYGIASNKKVEAYLSLVSKYLQ